MGGEGKSFSAAPSLQVGIPHCLSPHLSIKKLFSLSPSLPLHFPCRRILRHKLSLLLLPLPLRLANISRPFPPTPEKGLAISPLFAARKNLLVLVRENVCFDFPRHEREHTPQGRQCVCQPKSFPDLNCPDSKCPRLFFLI